MKILITGATSGIGKQLAIDYQEEGHEVIAIGRNENSLAELQDKGIQTAQVDLTKREESLSWFRSVDNLDLAILSAGTCEYIDPPGFDSALVQRVMRANVESMAISIEGVLPLLRRGKKPHLVGIGSSASYVPLPRAEAYGASKAAVSYMLDTLRIVLSQENIDVSLVCPGFVKTPLTDKNDFPMPSRISVQEASTYIRKGIKKRAYEIHFPKHFTFILKLMGNLPRFLWLKIAKGMVRNG